MKRRQRGAADFLQAAALRSRAPVTVTFQVTDRCNYSCSHCYQEHVDQDELSTSEIENILDQLVDEGVLFLTFMGGEFFMRPDADQLLQMAHDRGFALKVLSTGHHIHDKRADYLATLRPLQVDLSLYGARADIHEEITRQPGSWKRTYDAARRLIERNIKVVLKAPIMNSNAQELVAIEQLATEIGADYTFDAKITANENGDQDSIQLRMTEETLRQFYSGAMTGELAEAYTGADKQLDARPLSQTPCRAGQQICSIHPRGDVWPCNSLPLPVGNLRRQSFREIWHGSEKLDEVRNLRWASIAECNRCPIRQYCARCHGMALVEQGEIAGPSLEACRHAVATRDALRTAGVIPASETQMPPTWSRVDRDGQHPTSIADTSIKRSSLLRVLG